MHTAQTPYTVLVVSGDERQTKQNQKLARVQYSPTGRPFLVQWIAPGYHNSSVASAKLRRCAQAADAVLVGIRLSHAFRDDVFAACRECGTVPAHIPGGGTGVTGVLRLAGDEVDKLNVRETGCTSLLRTR